jgi:hypothetical protein
VQSALRVGVVLDATRQPAWIARTVRAIGASPYTELAFVTCVNTPRKVQRRGVFRRLYDQFDKRFFRSGHALLPEEVTPLAGDGSDVDVVVDFTAHASGLHARFGVWTIRTSASIGAFVRQDETTDALLEADGRPIARARASTDPMSLRRGSGRLLWKCSAMVVAALVRLHEEGALWDASELRLPAETRVSDALMLRTLMASTARYVARQLRRRSRIEQWVIAFSFDGKVDGFRGFHRILPPRDRFWADPFVVADGDSAHLFVEEFVYAENRGTLAVMEIRRDGTYSPAHRILDMPYHLSYPCVVRWNDEYYMLPETGENGTVELYRATRFPYDWELTDVLMRDMRVADATLFEDGGTWWLFLSTPPDGFTFDQLHLFHAPNPRGPWTPHPRNPIVTDVTIGRCGGRPFRRDGRLYRVAQNGARRYGRSINILEITKLTTAEYDERFARAIEPDWMRHLNATHTLNVDGDVTVIDGARYLWTVPDLSGKNRASSGPRGQSREFDGTAGSVRKPPPR